MKLYCTPIDISQVFQHLKSLHCSDAPTLYKRLSVMRCSRELASMCFWFGAPRRIPTIVLTVTLLKLPENVSLYVLTSRVAQELEGQQARVIVELAPFHALTQLGVSGF